MQDKIEKFLKGEIVTMKVVAKILQAAGIIKRLLLVDIHSKTALRHFKIPTENVSAVPELSQIF